MIEIRTATTQHIPVIHSLAHQIWPKTFEEILSAEQLDYMLDMMYSHQSLQNQIETQQHTFIIAYENKKPIGFAAYYSKDKTSHSLYKLDKIYVLPDQHGKGIGKKLIEYIISIIKPMGASILELNVNRSNNAVTFYQKLGFTTTSEVDFPIGEGYFMNDYVMQKSLTTFPPLP